VTERIAAHPQPETDMRTPPLALRPLAVLLVLALPASGCGVLGADSIRFFQQQAAAMDPEAPLPDGNRDPDVPCGADCVGVLD
jgi:hypothetical protein